MEWITGNIIGSISEMDRFCRKLENGTTELISDAADNKRGSLACAFCEELPREDENEEDNIKGYAQIPSNIKDADSYRAEYKR